MTFPSEEPLPPLDAGEDPCVEAELTKPVGAPWLEVLEDGQLVDPLRNPYGLLYESPYALEQPYPYD